MAFRALFIRRKKEQERRRKKKLGNLSFDIDEKSHLLGTSLYNDDDINAKQSYGQPIDFALIDLDDNLKQVLKQYDCMYWIFHATGQFPSKEFSLTMKAKRFLQLPFPKYGERITRDKILETGCIDWCVAHAFSYQTDYIGKIQATNNNNILVSALLMSVTAPLYISPPR